ncbi:hypothetical protein N7468_009370 [Penicillium chermesinum]|uniref:Pal1 cell morphology n=1 Tax=Penicillium chermesinum TaxID=63820 RepID=A0A9W9NHZ2_9EURO|nr:uncharacterized protein N7468_009370 [Penicillium chermesinum]KAJ5220166.1 hypothetical protein N7468_009370 [Penicillium chermesinum]KAJ6157615.1 hypothetical protein N7470_005207 [Penicillium chermesinum]
MNAPPAFGYPPGVSLAQTDTVSPTPANFGSNNPFRNRALSPSTAPAGNSHPDRPRSTNPFLDDSEVLSPQSAPGMSTGTTMISPVGNSDITNNTRDLFENLSIQVAPAPPAPQVAPFPQPNGARPTTSGGPRQPPSRSRPPRDRPSGRPVEPRAKDPKDPFDIFADPPALTKSSTSRPAEGRPRRQRRNSESSVMDRASKIFDDDEERKRRERRREREARHRDGKPRSSRKDRRLDIIDKLDVTSIYGTGMFHHDGPFDACNPHRNRKGQRTAPMQAFPKGSLNMALGGAGPNNSNIDINQFHGRMEEGYNDFSTAATRNTEGMPFDATVKLEPIHGSESMGLGTSTFLDGAPASRSAMARRQSENDESAPNGGGLGRTKSLAQRLRGKSGTGRVASPTEHRFGPTPAPRGSSHSASSNKATETNPFFQDYNEEFDRKGSRIQESQVGTTGRARAMSSPKQSTILERHRTNDDMQSPPAGGGFLNRMKSLRKPRPERRPSD